MPEPTLERVKWITYLAPPLLLGGLELVRQLFFPDLFASRWLYALFLLAAVVGMWLFAWAVGNRVAHMRNHLIHQNQELLALHHASMAIAGDLRLETVLQRVVSEAATLVGARYGAISLAHHEPRIEAFVTYGVDPSLHARLGSHPVGSGLLGIPVVTGEPVRIADIARDPRAAGFPAGHPVMERLLGVPVSSGESVVGNLYLADREDGEPFSAADEGSLVRFAALAAIAIENAVLHEQVQVLAITGERERIAREMHDSLAQVLAYVNTKSQAALAHLDQGQHDKARGQLEQLAATARDAYVDVREGILALRSASGGTGRGLFESIADYARRWEEQSGAMISLSLPPAEQESNLTPLAEVHLSRLVQEALSNVRKHANATRVSITMVATERGLGVTIADNGIGFDTQAIGRGAFPRFGLSTMRERAEASGGTFTLTSQPGAGTTIEVTLPTVSASP